MTLLVATITILMALICNYSGFLKRFVILPMCVCFSDNFIATLEEKPSKFGTQGYVRVYLNWMADLTQHPMRARMAGHITSLRHDDGNDTPRFEVIELPLKGISNQG